MNSYARFPDIMTLRKLSLGEENYPAGLSTIEWRRAKEEGTLRPFKSLLFSLRN
jgi:hypothetical protein